MLVCFLKMYQLGQCTNVFFMDNTKIHVCDNKRIFRHKVFAGIAPNFYVEFGLKEDPMNGWRKRLHSNIIRFFRLG